MDWICQTIRIIKDWTEDFLFLFYVHNNTGVLMIL